ncbi:MAG TPA: hypothetical protein DEQ09_03275 [Bacteroidales bacterium]|nr:hypothetical protein [Bacteroidales bacterium]
MKVLIKILLTVIVILALSVGSCKKQAKCGCDGDVINELLSFPVIVYFDTINTSAWFVPISNSMSTYYFCHPSDHMNTLKRYGNGSYLLVDGHVYWECNYLMRASNNPYYASYYKTYQVEVTDIYEDLYGKK